MEEAYLLLGSNVGDRRQHLDKAVETIGLRCGKVVTISSLYETEPWGLKEQSPFLNQAVKLETYLFPQALLGIVKAIEQLLGRKETVHWGPRVIDIDILFYGNEIINEEQLKVPHPAMHERRFTLEPLNEIAPSLVHPVLQKTIAELLQACPDTCKVKKV